jgi:hypothetical protein
MFATALWCGMHMGTTSARAAASDAQPRAAILNDPAMDGEESE